MEISDNPLTIDASLTYVLLSLCNETCSTHEHAMAVITQLIIPVRWNDL